MEIQIKKAAALVRKYKIVEFTYIFGSSIKNIKKPHDVDIGIFLKGDLNADDRLNLQISLGDGFEKIFKRRADIIILNNASPFIRHQVIKHGVLLFERRKGAAGKFCFQVMTEYFDAMVLQNYFYSALKRRWSHG